MSLEIAIQQNTAAINSLIDILSKAAIPAAPVAFDEPPVEAVKKKTKKEAPAEIQNEEPVAAEPAEPPAEVAAVITYDEAAASVVQVASKLGRARAGEILAQMKPGAKSLRDVDPTDFAAVICACELALA